MQTEGPISPKHCKGKMIINPSYISSYLWGVGSFHKDTFRNVCRLMNLRGCQEVNVNHIFLFFISWLVILSVNVLVKKGLEDIDWFSALTVQTACLEDMCTNLDVRTGCRWAGCLLSWWYLCTSLEFPPLCLRGRGSILLSPTSKCTRLETKCIYLDCTVTTVCEMYRCWYGRYNNMKPIRRVSWGSLVYRWLGLLV